jgi:hypothetical protein
LARFREWLAIVGYRLHRIANIGRRIASASRRVVPRFLPAGNRGICGRRRQVRVIIIRRCIVG